MAAGRQAALEIKRNKHIPGSTSPAVAARLCIWTWRAERDARDGEAFVRIRFGSCLSFFLSKDGSCKSEAFVRTRFGSCPSSEVSTSSVKQKSTEYVVACFQNSERCGHCSSIFRREILADEEAARQSARRLVCLDVVLAFHSPGPRAHKPAQPCVSRAARPGWPSCNPLSWQKRTQIIKVAIFEPAQPRLPRPVTGHPIRIQVSLDVCYEPQLSTRALALPANPKTSATPAAAQSTAKVAHNPPEQQPAAAGEEVRAFVHGQQLAS